MAYSTFRFFSVAFLLTFLLFSFVGYSSDAISQEEVAAVEEDVIIENPIDAYIKQDVDAERVPSVLFTFWEHEALDKAKKSRGFNRAPEESEIEGQNFDFDVPTLDPDERELRLGGITYRSDADWTIWLNGRRITPTAIPPEVLDLRVYKNYVEIKWIDSYTNKIFPVKLRANERFNMDTLIFLPG